MNEFLTDISWLIFRSTLFLSLGACVAVIGVMLIRPRSHRTIAMVWSMVLLAGVMLVPARFDIPWYTDSMVATSAPDAIGTTLQRAEPQSVPPSSSQEINHPPQGIPTASDQSQYRAAIIWDLIPVVWILGLMFIGGLALVSYLGLLLALRETWLPQRTWQSEYDVAAKTLGVATPPRLLVHHRLGPMVCLTPRGHCLVIPSDQWSSLRRPQRDVILKHELAHFIRRDVCRTVPARLIVLLHWFNPLAWLAAQRVEESAEWAADQIALRDDPQRTGDLASALLQLSQHAQCSRLFASAARGRSLTKRLKHLIEHTEITGDEPMLRRMALMMTMAAVLLAGAVQIRLVAQESERSPVANEAPRVSSKTAIEFASKLVGDDDLTQRFKASLHTEPGAVVLRDRAGYYQTMARQDARAQAIPRLFDELFESSDAGLTLRDGKEQFRAEYLADSLARNEDIAEMKAAIAEKAGRIDLVSDLDKLMHRFMTDDAAPIILYARQIRPRMNPGSEMMEQLFAEQFAKRGDGLYEIRPDAREQILQRLASFDERAKLLRRIQGDLAEFADGITPADELHTRFKTALKNPDIVTLMALPIFEGDRINRRLVDNIINQFEGAVREGAEGMILQDQAKQHIERILPGMERINKAAASIREPFNAFVAKIAEDDDLHRRLKQSMASDVTLIRTATRVQYSAANIKTAIDTYFSRMLQEDDDGRLSVHTNIVNEEQLIGIVSGILREARMAKRKGREVTEFTQQVVDADLKEAMLSSGGKLVIGDELRKRYLQNGLDGLAQFVSEHFESTGDGYAIRDDRRFEIEDFVKHVGEVQQELENADF